MYMYVSIVNAPHASLGILFMQCRTEFWVKITFSLVTDTEKCKLVKEETKNCLMLALLLVEWHISICNMAGQMSQIICSCALM